MATRTSVGSGNWATAGTWDTGVPADGDDVVIASGHTVTFNADQSAFSTGVKITITGTLNHALTGGPYTMFIKTGASVVGAGTWNIGTSANPIPFAVKHTITGAAGWYVDGVSGLTMTVYGAEPTYTTIKLSGDEAIGQTELSVDTNVTGDLWADGDIIRIDDINKAAESEERIIAAGGRAAGAITVTEGLTLAKSTGAVVSLITRNIKIIAVGMGSRTIYRVTGDGKLTVGGGMWYGVSKYMMEACTSVTITGGTFSGNSTGLYSCIYATITGGTFSGNSNGISSCTSPTITGGTFSGNGNGMYSCTSVTITGATFSGNSNGISSCTSVTITGGTFSGNGNALYSCTPVTITGGTFSGNTNSLSSCNSATITGGTFSGNNTGLYFCISPIITGATFSGNSNGLYSCTSVTITGATFSGNTYDLRATNGYIHGINLTAATEHYKYTSMTSMGAINCQSVDHDGNDGAVKAWCIGGVVTSQTSVKPDGYTQAYQHALESATYPAFWYKAFSVEPGKTVNIEVQLRKDASMTYLPRAYLMASIGNPLAGDTPVDTFTMTDSIDTWESDTFSITNSTDYDQDYTLWFVGQNATGNAYSAYKISQVMIKKMVIRKV